MKLWKQSTALIIMLFIAFAIHLTLGGPADIKYQNHYHKNANDVENRQGLLAGPMFLALSSMFFPVLPLVMMAPLAIAGLGPAVGYISDAMASSSSSPSSSTSSATAGQNAHRLSDILQKLSSSNGGVTSPQQQMQQSTIDSPSSSALSSLKKLSQALGLSESASDQPESASSSIISSFFDDSDKKAPSSSSSSSPSSSSSMLNSLLSRPTTNSPSKDKPPTDFLGAAAAALDNAGLLGPISGAGTGSVTEQILKLVTGNKASSQASTSSTSSSSSLSSLLGLSDSIAAGSSLSPSLANVYSDASSGVKPQSQSSESSPPVSSQISSDSSLNSGNIQKLANNALNRISDFIFTRRRSSTSGQSILSFDTMASKAKGGIFTYVKDVFSTLKDGVKHYEISESECQSRLMCELNQKAMGRSFKSWANSLFDVFNLEGYLDASSFTSRTKSTAKDILRAARDGFSEKDCAKLYSRCPVHVVEATKHHLMAQAQQLQSANKSPQINKERLEHANRSQQSSGAIAFKRNTSQANPSHNNVNTAHSQNKPIIYNQTK